MILTVDIGNSEIAFGLCKEGRVVEHWQLCSSLSKTTDEYQFHLQGLLSLVGADIPNIQAAVLCSVVPSLTTKISQALQNLLNTAPLVVNQQNLQLAMDVENPAEVGADRLVSAYASFKKYQRALIVVDFGTAITLDVVSKTGVYLGGAIMPGGQIALDALSKATAKLPAIELQTPVKALGKNTQQCLQSGLVFGVSHMVNGLALQIEQELGESLHGVATGGMCSLFTQHCPFLKIQDEDLILWGLQHFFMQQTQ